MRWELTKLRQKDTSRLRSGKDAIIKRCPLQKPRWEKTKITIRYLHHENMLCSHCYSNLHLVYTKKIYDFIIFTNKKKLILSHILRFPFFVFFLSISDHRDIFTKLSCIRFDKFRFINYKVSLGYFS